MKSQEYDKQSEQVIQMLKAKVEVKPSLNMRERVVSAVAQSSVDKGRRTKFGYWIGATLSMAAVVVVAITLTLNSPLYAARKYFSKAILAANDIRTMIMELRVRSMPDEPMEYINPDCDFVSATIKVIYDEPMLWSAEKYEGRNILYRGADEHGDNIYQWIDNEDGGVGWIHERRGYLGGDFAAMLNPTLLLDAEYRLAKSRKSALYDIVEMGDWVKVKVETDAQGDFSESDYMLNTSLSESNTIREYTFDKNSGQLVKMSIDILRDGARVTVIESESIIYNQPLDVEMLSDKDLSSVVFSSAEFDSDDLSPLVGISAGEAARMILDAMGRWDMEILDTALYYYGNFMEMLESEFKGLMVLSMEKPFKSGLYPGYFVKCRVRLVSGVEKDIVLALRNDNKDGVWLLDGGI